mgnify:CR=1 FL=1
MIKFLNSYGEYFCKFLKVDGWLFCLLVILNLPPLFQTYVLFGTEEFNQLFLDEFEAFYFGAVIILIFCLLIHFGLKNFPRAKFALQIFILISFVISFVVEMFIIYTFKDKLILHFVEVAVATNFNEAKEFFQVYVFKTEIFFGLLAFGLIIFTAVKKIRQLFQNLSDERLKKLSYHTLIIFFPAFLSAVYCIGNFLFNVTCNTTTLARNLRSVYIATIAASSEDEIFAEMDSQNEKIISNNSKIPYVVLVLGESATRNHMQIYGYNLKNTPLAVKRYERGELFKFNDVISCANGTSIAMKQIFNFAEKEDELENWYKTPNIFDIVNRAGYNTAWISNQSIVGWMGNIDKIYSERCNEKYFSEMTDNKNKEIWTRDFDGVLLPVIDDFISHSQEKNFYCVHLYGSHQYYRDRYPAEFEKFTADDENKSTDEMKKITAEYDNSILYTDFILDEIFKRFEDKNALVIYFSDHGQEIYENDNNFAGPTPEENGSRSMIEIPFIIWTSKSFREMYPEKVAALKNSADNPYRTDFLIHTILDLMDIQTENFDATKSIVNEKFDKFRLRIYNNKPYIRG